MEKKVKEDIIEYGFEHLSGDVTLKLSVKDLVFLYRTTEELRRFFHNKDHFKNEELLSTFIGNREKGIYSVLNDVYFEELGNVISSELEEKLESEEMYCPNLPIYYKN